MKRVAVLTYNQAAFFELGCALELFALERPEFESWYQCEVVTFDQQPLNFLGGVSMSVVQVTDLNDYDMLVIPSWPVMQHNLDPDMAAQIQQFHAAGKRIISFCSGAFLLGYLGLLCNRNGTTHWRYADKFQQFFPEVNYVADVLYVFDGTLGCSAGSSAAIDLGIEVIRQDYGFKVANSVARRLVLSAHRKGGQTQFAETPVQVSNSQFASTIDWATQNIQLQFGVEQLATKANMSRRNFDRKFKANYNLTPKEWLNFQRLNLAKEYLENHDYDVEKIAELAGFGNATTMRHHFRKELGISPTLHRERFKSC